MKQARDKRAAAIWLHVRDDNPGAIKLYQDLGFQEVARRTTWQASPDPRIPSPDTDIQIVPRQARFWSLQQEWLRRLYPDDLAWYHSWNISGLRPGLWNWLYLLFVDFNIKQWAAVRNDKLLATLTWVPQGSRSESLFAAAGTGSEPEALTSLLIHAQRMIPFSQRLTLEYPAGEMAEAIRVAGFKQQRTLLWMRATGVNDLRIRG
jgi:hypothetical protein